MEEKPRPLRFSLRTLFTVMTLCAVLAWLATYTTLLTKLLPNAISFVAYALLFAVAWIVLLTPSAIAGGYLAMAVSRHAFGREAKWYESGIMGAVAAVVVILLLLSQARNFF